MRDICLNSYDCSPKLDVLHLNSAAANCGTGSYLSSSGGCVENIVFTFR